MRKTHKNTELALDGGLLQKFCLRLLIPIYKMYRWRNGLHGPISITHLRENAGFGELRISVRKEVPPPLGGQASSKPGRTERRMESVPFSSLASCSGGEQPYPQWLSWSSRTVSQLGPIQCGTVMNASEGQRHCFKTSPESLNTMRQVL